jgi:hypothetical protein
MALVKGVIGGAEVLVDPDLICGMALNKDDDGHDVLQIILLESEQEIKLTSTEGATAFFDEVVAESRRLEKLQTENCTCRDDN